MLKLTKLCIIIIVCGFLFSCSTTYKIGKQYSTNHVADIVIGRTSESEIISHFGDPWKIGLFNGNIVYTYCYEEIVIYNDDSVEKRGNTLIIEFDQNKKVMNYYFNIPGKGPQFFGLLFHKNIKNKQQQEQVAWQNQIANTPAK